MIEHSTVPFTIIKETNGGTTDDQYSQYKWKAEQYPVCNIHTHKIIQIINA